MAHSVIKYLDVKGLADYASTFEYGISAQTAG
jgi:hypothetical protein